jgi:hypothetical protein
MTEPLSLWSISNRLGNLRATLLLDFTSDSIGEKLVPDLSRFSSLGTSLCRSSFRNRKLNLFDEYDISAKDVVLALSDDPFSEHQKGSVLDLVGKAGAMVSFVALSNLRSSNGNGSNESEANESGSLDEEDQGGA